jgi:hypothetical protein
VPLNYVIDRKGKVVTAFYGANKDKGLEALEEALEGGSSKPAGVAGTVLGPDASALVGAFVRLHPARQRDVDREKLNTRTDSGGRYEILDVPSGSYDLVVQLVGDVSYVAPVGRLRLRPGKVLDYPIRLPDTRLGGTITRADTGAPLGSRAVSISARRIEMENGEFVRARDESASAWADHRGRYVFIGIPPGHYKIFVSPKDVTLQRVNRVVDFTKGGELERVDFKIESRRLGTLRIKVLEPSGKPAVENLHFSEKTEQTGGTSWSRSLRPEALGKGVYAIQLEVGSRSVSVYRKGHWVEVLKVEIKEGKTVKLKVKLRKREH